MNIKFRDVKSSDPEAEKMIKIFAARMRIAINNLYRLEQNNFADPVIVERTKQDVRECSVMFSAMAEALIEFRKNE